MQNRIEYFLAAGIGLWFSVATVATAADSLPANGSLLRGHFLSSSGYGAYQLHLYTDGAARIMRTNGTTRYSMGNNADVLAMQADGNLVLYQNPGVPVWYTGTQNNPGAFAKVYDDGDLVVHNSAGIPIWRLGSDITAGDPTEVADVLGRDLNITGTGYLGHLGVWDGGRIFQVAPPVRGNNAVSIETLFNFKHTPTNTGGYAAFWGTASFNIPAGTISMTGCWDISCSVINGTVNADARYSVALRMTQIYRIGADYTMWAESTRAEPAFNGRPMQRGVYRCDTFILDALRQSTYYPQATMTNSQAIWQNRWNEVNNGPKTPGIIFSKLKSYQ